MAGKWFLRIIVAVMAVGVAMAPFNLVRLFRNHRALVAAGDPAPARLSDIDEAPTDRRIILQGGRWRCDQAIFRQSTRSEMAWIPVDDDRGRPRLLIQRFSSAECNPRDGVVGLLTEDGGLLGARFPSEAPASLRQLRILVVGKADSQGVMPFPWPNLLALLLGPAFFGMFGYQAWRQLR